MDYTYVLRNDDVVSEEDFIEKTTDDIITSIEYHTNVKQNATRVLLCNNDNVITVKIQQWQKEQFFYFDDTPTVICIHYTTGKYPTKRNDIRFNVKHGILKLKGVEH